MLELLQIIDLSEINFVKTLRLLRWLNLLRNPVQELPDYRLSILFQIHQLSQLDRKKVDVQEKVSPVNMPLVASTGPVLGQCWQHRPSTLPVLAHNGMFMGYV